MKKFALILLAGMLLSGCATTTDIYTDADIGSWSFYGGEEDYSGVVYLGEDDMALTPQDYEHRYFASSGFVDNVAFISKCLEYKSDGNCKVMDIAMMDATGHLLNRFGEYNYPELKVIEDYPPYIAFVDLAGTQEQFPTWKRRETTQMPVREKVFSDDRLLIEQSGLYGFVDRTGRAVIAPRFMAAENFRNAEARVFSDQGFGIIDIYGKFTADKYACITPYNASFFKVNIGGQIVNYSADIRSQNALYVSDSLKLAHEQRPDAADICTGGKWGLADPSMNIIIPPEFDEIVTIDSLNLLWVHDYEKNISGYYTMQGELVLKPENPVAHLGEYFSIVQNSEGKYALYDPKGNRITEFEYDNFMSKSVETGVGLYLLSEYAIMSKDGKWGVLQNTGEVTVPFEYDELTSESEGLIAFRRNKRWGVIDTKNNEIMSPIYTSVGMFEDGRATAVLAGDQIYIYRDDNARNAWHEKERLERERNEAADRQAQMESRMRQEAIEQERLNEERRQRRIISESEILRLQKEINAIDERLNDLMPAYDSTRQDSLRREIEKLQNDRTELENRIQQLQIEQ